MQAHTYLHGLDDDGGIISLIAAACRAGSGGAGERGRGGGGRAREGRSSGGACQCLCWMCMRVCMSISIRCIFYNCASSYEKFGDVSLVLGPHEGLQRSIVVDQSTKFVGTSARKRQVCTPK
jgi:hypothetical protein